MGSRTKILRVGLITMILVGAILPAQSRVDALAPELQITQLNITGEEYVTIQNTGSSAIDLSNYWLGYNSNDSATAVPSQQLPIQVLQPQETLVLNNGSVATCGAVVIDDLTFSPSNTAGKLALWRHDQVDGSSSFAFLGSVAWGKGATNGNYLHIADEANVTKYNTISGLPVWLKNADKWQVGDMQGCVFTPVVSATTTEALMIIEWPISDETPPFVVLAPVSLKSGGGSGGSIPASDIGLKALVLSEILPNPASPKTDADDEFIELYNPNNKPFDLSGFKLQIASTTSVTLHNYTIPSGTSIPPKGFKAFMSADTNLSLNNTGGQVWFVDPLNHTVTTSGVYTGVKEGAAFINTNGKWQWTMSPTPGSANKLQAPAASTSSSKKASVNGRGITGVKSSSGIAGAGTNAASAYDAATQTVPLHPATLAVVIGLALLYLGYEYRRDVANKIHQFRENRANRA